MGRLVGTTMQIVQRQLDRLGVTQREERLTVGDLDGLSAVVMNSWTPQVPVFRIGPRRLTPDATFTRLLVETFRAEALVAV